MSDRLEQLIASKGEDEALRELLSSVADDLIQRARSLEEWYPPERPARRVAAEYGLILRDAAAKLRAAPGRLAADLAYSIAKAAIAKFTADAMCAESFLMIVTQHHLLKLLWHEIATADGADPKDLTGRLAYLRGDIEAVLEAGHALLRHGGEAATAAAAEGAEGGG